MACLLSLAPAGAGAQEAGQVDANANDNDNEVLVARIDSPIQVVVADFVEELVADAEATSAAALILELNTPGGDLISTRRITSAILESRVPVVVYVAPRGAQAASAGFFILMSADFAVMAPASNTGAAHPVAGGGQDIEGDLGKKAEEDTAAYARSLAQRRGRDLDLVQQAVVESRSYSAQEAIEAGLIDAIAGDLDDLLAQLDGREVMGKDAPPLRLAGAARRDKEMAPLQKVRSILVSPNIALLLLSLGGLGLYVEISNPGAMFPGIVGAIFLILGLYSLSVLPLNFAGLALLALAAVLFLLELKVPSFGLLTLGGMVATVLGAVLLFDHPDPALRVSLQLVITVAVALGLSTLSLGRLAVRAHRTKVATGREGLVAERGVSRSVIDRRGKVQVHGEIWNAISDVPIAAGHAVEVVAVDGMTLKVRPLDS